MPLGRHRSSASEAGLASSTAFAYLIAGSMSCLMGRDLAEAQRHAATLEPLDGAGLLFGAWARLLAASGVAYDSPSGAHGSGSAVGRDRAGASAEGLPLPAIGAGAGHVAQLLVQAHVFGQCGRQDRGLAALDQARAWIGSSGVRVLEAEVWRVRGELNF